MSKTAAIPMDKEIQNFLFIVEQIVYFCNSDVAGYVKLQIHT